MRADQILQDIRKEIDRFRYDVPPCKLKQQHLTLIINNNTRLKIARWIFKHPDYGAVITVDELPRKIYGIPYTVDNSQKAPFRMVER